MAVIDGVRAVDPEIVRVDRSEQRIVRAGIPLTSPLEKLEPRLGAGGRELKMVRRHVAGGTRAAVSAEMMESLIEERAAAARDGVARSFTSTLIVTLASPTRFKDEVELAEGATSLRALRYGGPP